ncbi:hypothetical protein B0H34DRAFT_431210 [Crassisporium funariophilum]|nr:hypothetical protein B0H34DRAFT_431210 [Crassisporium funariophilum]
MGPPNVPQPVYHDHSLKLANLRKLTIRSTIQSHCFRGRYSKCYAVPLPWMVHFLTSIIPPRNSMQSISLQFTVNLGHSTETFKKVDWAGLAFVLTSELLSGLRSVYLGTRWGNIHWVTEPMEDSFTTVLEEDEHLLPLIRSGLLTLGTLGDVD